MGYSVNMQREQESYEGQLRAYIMPPVRPQVKPQVRNASFAVSDSGIVPSFPITPLSSDRYAGSRLYAIIDSPHYPYEDQEEKARKKANSFPPIDLEKMRGSLVGTGYRIRDSGKQDYSQKNAPSYSFSFGGSGGASYNLGTGSQAQSFGSYSSTSYPCRRSNPGTDGKYG